MDETIKLIHRLLDKIDNFEEVNRNIKKFVDIQENKMGELKLELNKERSLRGSREKELERLEADLDREKELSYVYEKELEKLKETITAEENLNE